MVFGLKDDHIESRKGRAHEAEKKIKDIVETLGMEMRRDRKDREDGNVL